MRAPGCPAGDSSKLPHLLPVLPVPFFDALYRTVLIAVFGVVLVYKLKISEDANKIADKILKKSK